MKDLILDSSGVGSSAVKVEIDHRPPDGFFLEIYLRALEKHHAVFYAIVNLVEPNFSTSIKQSAVKYNKLSGQYQLLINPRWFEKLTFNDQIFVFAHEALHVLFEHAQRTLRYNHDPKLSNVAQDIVINEMLVDHFGFFRSELKLEDICFINTIFTAEEIVEHKILPRQSFEFYLDILMKLYPPQSPREQLLDALEDLLEVESIIEYTQDGESNSFGEGYKEVLEELIEDVKNSISNEESKDFQKISVAAGQAGLDEMFKPIIKKIKKIRTWEQIVKNKIASLLKSSDLEEETFTERPRRIISLPADMHIPAIKEYEIEDQNRYRLYFFLDSSGSCWNYKQKFIDILRSIPEDKFEVNAFSFDTATHYMNIKNPSIRGGGGTSFSILENRIQRDMVRDKTKYPDLVFVLTDGWGDDVDPDKPDRWFWILTPEGETSCFPSSCTVIKINRLTKEYFD